MRPHSRGSLPAEYSIRVSCELEREYDIFAVATQSSLLFCGVACSIQQENGALLVTASGFPTLKAAKEYFYELQRQIASIMVDKGIGVVLPTLLEEPTLADFSFVAGWTPCTMHGWPEEQIKPLLISNLGACVYPEHEFVAIAELMRIVPRFGSPISLLSDGLAAGPAKAVSRRVPLDAVLLLAVTSYVCARRSTQAVWSFLLTVMTLEMLVTDTVSNVATKVAIKTLIEHSEATFDAPQTGVDVLLIKNCLNQASKASRSVVLRSLIRDYCAPGVAKQPREDLFLSVDDCNKKVKAVYDARSTYVHQGRVPANKTMKYTFSEVNYIASEALGHILKMKIDEDNVALGSE